MNVKLSLYETKIRQFPLENITFFFCVFAFQIKWRAELSAINLKHESKSQLFMKWKDVNDDDDDDKEEKKQNENPINSSLILFDCKQKDYEYRFKYLDKNKDYTVKLYLYEKRKDGNIECIDIFDNILFSFKTMDGFDFNDEEFKYESDYDKYGICYFFGTNYGQNVNKWINPVKSGKIKVSTSGWDCGSVEDIVGREAVCSRSSSKENAWIIIDFGRDKNIKPTYYTLRHWTINQWYIKNWNLMGSVDGKKWVLIKKHSYWFSPFKKPKQSLTFRIEGCDDYYQMFKIQMTSTNSGDTWRICVTGFEVYGYLTGNK